MMRDTDFLTILMCIILAVCVVFIFKWVEDFEDRKSSYHIEFCEDSNQYPSSQDMVIRYNIESKHVREYDFRITKEMDIISKFIKSKNNRTSQIVADRISYSVINTCSKENLPTELIIGIMFIEAFYDPSALGPKIKNRSDRARGLMQVLDNHCNGKPIDKSLIHNIDYNIEKGIEILKTKLKATAKNNKGIGDVDKALFYYVGKDEKYANKVFKIMGEFRYFRSQLLSK